MRRSIPSTVPIVIFYTIGTFAGGTATAGSDFAVVVSGNVTLAVGATSVSIPLDAVQDAIAESGETLRITLTSAGPGGAIGNAITTVTITDNDAVLVSVADASFYEADPGAIATISLSRTASSDVLVKYATAPLTATPGADYAAVSGEVRIVAGTTSVAVPLSLVGDGIEESDETFRVYLHDMRANVTVFSLGSNGTVTILDRESRYSPRLRSCVYDDPDDGDAQFSVGDTVTATFDQPTSAPPVGRLSGR